VDLDAAHSVSIRQDSSAAFINRVGVPRLVAAKVVSSGC
jgi:hypothetical protein